MIWTEEKKRTDRPPPPLLSAGLIIWRDWRRKGQQQRETKRTLLFSSLCCPRKILGGEISLFRFSYWWKLTVLEGKPLCVYHGFYITLLPSEKGEGDLPLFNPKRVYKRTGYLLCCPFLFFPPFLGRRAVGFPFCLWPLTSPFVPLGLEKGGEDNRQRASSNLGTERGGRKTLLLPCHGFLLLLPCLRA